METARPRADATKAAGLHQYMKRFRRSETAATEHVRRGRRTGHARARAVPRGFARRFGNSRVTKGI